MSGPCCATRALRWGAALLALVSLTISPSVLAGPARPKNARAAAVAGTADSTSDNDQTLHAMRDEMARSRARLRSPDTDALPPYFIEYRLLDIEQRTVTATFGALLSSNTSRNRLMDVGVRVGDYKLDSSNFIGGDEGFRGFIGATGSVGIDGDYDSLRQDL